MAQPSEVAQGAQAREKEIGATAHSDELWQPGNTITQVPIARLVEIRRHWTTRNLGASPEERITLSRHPGELGIHDPGILRNSNWREMLAFRQMK